MLTQTHAHTEQIEWMKGSLLIYHSISTAYRQRQMILFYYCLRPTVIKEYLDILESAAPGPSLSVMNGCSVYWETVCSILTYWSKPAVQTQTHTLPFNSLGSVRFFCNLYNWTHLLIYIRMHSIYQKWQQRHLYCLQKISIINKCCSSELSIHQRKLKKYHKNVKQHNCFNW